jgi:hypothetical protein
MYAPLYSGAELPPGGYEAVSGETGLTSKDRSF